MAGATTTKALRDWLAALSHATTFDLRFVPDNRGLLTAEEASRLPDSHRQKIVEARDKPGSFIYLPQQFPNLTADEVLRRLDLAAHYNACGFHIFARPENYRYVFLDDIADFNGTDGMPVRGEWRIIKPTDGGPGHRHTVQVESSPGNHQFWLDAGPGCTDEWTNKALALHLTRRFGADAGAVNRRQSGRLPGYRNVKAKHRQDGAFPTARLHTHTQRIDPVLASLVETAEIQQLAAELGREAAKRQVTLLAREERSEERRQQIAAGITPAGRAATATSDPIKVGKLPDISTEYQDAWSRIGSSSDRSAADFGIICRMARLVGPDGMGYGEDDLVDVVANYSPKAKERGYKAGHAYAVTTVGNAFARVQG